MVLQAAPEQTQTTAPPAEPVTLADWLASYSDLVTWFNEMRDKLPSLTPEEIHDKIAEIRDLLSLIGDSEEPQAVEARTALEFIKEAVEDRLAVVGEVSPEDAATLVTLRTRYRALQELAVREDPALSEKADDIDALVADINDLYEVIGAQGHYELSEMLYNLERYEDMAEALAVGRQEFATAAIEDVRARIREEVEYWQYYDEENVYAINRMVDRYGNWVPLFVSSWRPFGTGGTIPSAIVWARSKFEGLSVTIWADRRLDELLLEQGLLDYRASTVTYGVAQGVRVGTQVARIYNNDLTLYVFQEQLATVKTTLIEELHERMDVGEENLMHWETVFNEYFRFVNETQFLNQWFYGRIFFPTLAWVGKQAIRPLLWLFAKNGKRISMLRRADRTRQLLVIEALGQHKEAFYQYTLELMVADAYTGVGIATLGAKLPVIGSTPPDSWKQIARVWRQWGLVIDEDEFIRRVWPYVKSLGPDDLATMIQQGQFIEHIKRMFLTQLPVNGVAQSMLAGYAGRTMTAFDLIDDVIKPVDFVGGPGHSTIPIGGQQTVMGFVDDLKQVNPSNFTDFLRKGAPMLAVPLMATQIVNLLEKPGAAAEIAGEVTSVEEEDEAFGSFEAMETAFAALLDRELQARGEEIFENVFGRIFPEVRESIEQKMRNNAYNTPEEVEADMQAMMHDHRAELDVEIERVAQDVIENMDDDAWAEIAAAPEVDAEEALGREWFGLASGYVVRISNAQNVGGAQAAFELLAGMAGTAPVEAIMGVQLEPWLDGQIQETGTYVRDWAEAEEKNEQS